jgi:hypothetical protein
MAKDSIRYIANCHVDILEIAKTLNEMGVYRVSLCEIDDLARLIARGHNSLTRDDVAQRLKPSRFEPHNDLTSR